MSKFLEDLFFILVLLLEKVADYLWVTKLYARYNWQYMLSFYKLFCDFLLFVKIFTSPNDIMEVDYDRRKLIIPNHTCKHMLNFALRVRSKGPLSLNLFIIYLIGFVYYLSYRVKNLFSECSM